MSVFKYKIRRNPKEITEKNTTGVLAGLLKEVS